MVDLLSVHRDHAGQWALPALLLVEPLSSLRSEEAAEPPLSHILVDGSLSLVHLVHMRTGTVSTWSWRLRGPTTPPGQGTPRPSPNASSRGFAERQGLGQPIRQGQGALATAR
jgi:hypothetical protein